MIDGSKLGLRLFRNQTGSYELKDGRWITSGLCVGSSDLIGYYPIIVTPDLVGKTIAVFVGIEAKGPTGRIRPEQAKFLEVIKRAGALATVTTEPDLTATLAAWWAR